MQIKRILMKKSKLTILILLLLVGAYFGYNYLYQDHRDIETETAQFTIQSKPLINEFITNAALAEKKYLNKTIEVSGLISEINKTDITIDNYIFNSFNTDFNRNELKIGSSITIKGRFIGYDDLLEVIKLDQCILKN